MQNLAFASTKNWKGPVLIVCPRPSNSTAVPILVRLGGCMCACSSSSVCACTHACKHARLHECLCAGVHACACVCVRTCTRRSVCGRPSQSVCAYERADVLLCWHTNMRALKPDMQMRVRARACVRARKHARCVCDCAYARMCACVRAHARECMCACVHTRACVHEFVSLNNIAVPALITRSSVKFKTVWPPTSWKRPP